jgi:hypothetical protein
VTGAAVRATVVARRARRLMSLGQGVFLAVVALGLLLLPARVYRWWGLSAGEEFGAFTVVVGEWVPTSFDVELALTGAAVLAVLIGGGIVLCQELPPLAPEHESSLGRTLAALSRLTAFIGSVLAMMLMLRATWISTPDYRVLPGFDPTGCRMVERVRGYSSDYGVVSPGSIVVRRVVGHPGTPGHDSSGRAFSAHSWWRPSPLPPSDTGHVDSPEPRPSGQALRERQL